MCLVRLGAGLTKAPFDFPQCLLARRGDDAVQTNQWATDLSTGMGMELVGVDNW